MQNYLKITSNLKFQFVKIELPPIASPSFELNRQSSFAIELNRLLERAIVKR